MSVDERIAAVTSEIEYLQEQVKEKKAQLKALKAEKAEEDQKRIMIAVLESGRSVDEVIELLKG
jgi:phage shock protein A